MELYSAQIRYLLAIYQLGKVRPDVATSEIAEFLQVKKASVSRMIPILMEKGLVTKKRYGKLYLTEEGTSVASQLENQVEQLTDIIGTQFSLPQNSAWRVACAAVCELPQTTPESIQI